MTDIVEQAARVIGAGRLILRDNGKRNNEKIAQALADAGLLRDPARTVPTREEIGEVVCAKSHYDGNCGCGRDDRTADAVLALMADQPTVAEVKAQALEEAATEIKAQTLEEVAHVLAEQEHFTKKAQGAKELKHRAQQHRGRK